MFTGIIQEVGIITKIQDFDQIKTLTVKAPNSIKTRKIGDSIAVNGICSTITAINKDEFAADYIPETLKITTAKNFQKDQEVNIEIPMQAGDTFDGHFVQGHADCTGKVIKIHKDNDEVELTIEFSKKFSKLTSIKGSITIDGVSLTITRIEIGQLTVALIPHTLKETTLGQLQEGDEVNLEFDMIAKHIKNLLDAREDEVKYEFLRERNLI